MAQKRIVSNEEYTKAYNNKDNRNIIQSYIKKYRKSLPWDVRKSTGMYALWRCMQYHEEGHGQKFTTSLCRFLGWEFNRQWQKYSKQKESVSYCDGFANKKADDGFFKLFEDSDALYEYLAYLDESDAQLVEDYFVKGLSVKKIAENNGEAYDKACKRFKRVLQELKLIVNV